MDDNKKENLKHSDENKNLLFKIENGLITKAESVHLEQHCKLSHQKLLVAESKTKKSGEFINRLQESLRKKEPMEKNANDKIAEFEEKRNEAISLIMQDTVETQKITKDINLWLKEMSEN